MATKSELLALARKLAENHDEAELRELLAIAEEKKARAAEVAKQAARQGAVVRIGELLQSAKDALQEAGTLAANYGIPFTFATPRGDTIVHPGRWMDSACYVGDGWYAERFAYSGGAPKSSVDGMTLEDDYSFTSWESSANC